MKDEQRQRLIDLIESLNKEEMEIMIIAFNEAFPLKNDISISSCDHTYQK